VRRLRLSLRLIPEGLIAFLLLLLLASILVPAVSPFDPLVGDPRVRLQPPALQWEFWRAHVLGTDQQGRDVFVRLTLGARYSFLVAAIAVGLGGSVGLSMGILAGYFGEAIDSLVMRVVDVVLSFPTIFLALLLASVFGPSILLVSLALAFHLWAAYARLIRAQTLSLVDRDFVRSARVAGATPWQIIVIHILPHVMGTFVVLVTLQVSVAIFAESSLSFLGAGVPAPLPAWGSMGAEGRSYITSAWWVSVFPGFAILLVALSFNLLGDWLRDWLDPRSQDTRAMLSA
jgi:peptide/nickel transport system permease protein